jgi:rod shape-determining protein MreD
MIMCGYVALVVTASLQALLGWRIPTPELPLLIVLYLGLKERGSGAGHVGTALALGYLADLFAGSPIGLSSLTLGALMLLARAASSRLDVETPWHTVLIALAATVAHGVFAVMVTSSLYSGDALHALRLVPLTAIATAVVAPLMFRVLMRIDRRVSPEPTRLRLS